MPVDLMNLSQKESVSEEVMIEVKKSCADCKTTKTPLWRGGPAGPRSLCNACGIRCRKKRTAVQGLNNGSEKRRETSTTGNTNKITAAANNNNYKTSVGGGGVSTSGKNLGEDLRVRLVAFGKEVVMLQRQRTPMKRQRKLGEEEQAAALLMSLSCSSVFA